MTQVPIKRSNLPITQGPSKIPPLKPKTPGSAHMPAKPVDSIKYRSPKMRKVSDTSSSIAVNRVGNKSEGVAQSVNKKREVRQSDDVWAESRRLHEEMEKEFGIKISDSDDDLPWLDELEQMKRDLEDNFIKENYIDASVLSTVDNATRNLVVPDDPYEALGAYAKAGIGAVQTNIAVERKLLEERINLLTKIGETLMMHSPGADYTADLMDDEIEPDEIRKDDKIGDGSIKDKK